MLNFLLHIMYRITYKSRACKLESVINCQRIFPTAEDTTLQRFDNGQNKKGRGKTDTWTYY